MSSQQPAIPTPSSGPLDSGNPVTLPRTVTVMLSVIGVVAIGAAVSGAAGIVAPTMLALVLTIGVLPVEAWTRRHSWPGWLGTLFALVTAYAIVAVLLIGTVICLVKLVDLLPQYTNDAQNLTDEAQSGLSDAGPRHRQRRARPSASSTPPRSPTCWPASSQGSWGPSADCSSW